ncbi:hypothetical protein L228DRAFT_222567 [Xylona heveae TC161]|uniref:Thioredoxin-like fold domain-containing protein n=1 Tax=Xylona heveae (strain CBS 132557 / TC161) TaxID=1328760 RepID=A0A165AIA9_XYLHT|nr:hypothetical protein L228DRAFT_222567 [Xylona heveae TC161]KZF20523.1 hypothetical protein L228DRAFT_222567 [Xylona heveae TC161]
MAGVKPQASITLYRGWTGSGYYVWSPFVTKLEARLRFGGLSYKCDGGSPMKAPRGKIPYVAIENEKSSAPTLLCDTTLITDRLAEEGMLGDLNAKLSPTEKAQDLAFTALLEDKLYFYQLYERWQENYYTMRPGVLQALPYPMQLIVGLIAYRKVMQTLHGQGTSRFTPEEIDVFRRKVWENVNALLVTSKAKAKAGDASTFWALGGTGPSEFDATLFGFIASALVCPAGPESQKVIRSFPVVVEYAKRIHDRYFPDYELWKE